MAQRPVLPTIHTVCTQSRLVKFKFSEESDQFRPLYVTRLYPSIFDKMSPNGSSLNADLDSKSYTGDVFRTRKISDINSVVIGFDA